MLILLCLIVLFILILGCWQALVTDPYYKNTTVSTPFGSRINHRNEIELITLAQLQLNNSPLAEAMAWLKTGLRIPLYAFLYREQPLPGATAQIIDQIHGLRFNPDRPYVVTGSNYPDLYMRNMGVFFNALLDPRLPTSEADWQNRQRLALQTIAYDLAFITQHKKAVTTIVPLGQNQFTGLNIYTPPSDALHAIFYTLNALTDSEYIYALFPLRMQNKNSSDTRNSKSSTDSLRAEKTFTIQTQTAAQKLLAEHHSSLTTALDHYLTSTLNPVTHLVNQDIHISSARDGVKRSSSFYDNVIAWATVQAADALGVAHQETLPRDKWKQLIIKHFWNENLGIFKDELEKETIFSADSLIVTSTQFLDLDLPADCQKLSHVLDYIEKQGLDQPFPLKYSSRNQNTQMHWAVKYFAPSYMGDGIWSHWGMEYIKALLMLAADDPKLAKRALKHLDAYEQNINKFGGYPELYKANGDFFTSPLMKSVLHTGWVVNYEQARVMAGLER